MLEPMSMQAQSTGGASKLAMMEAMPETAAIEVKDLRKRYGEP